MLNKVPFGDVEAFNVVIEVPSGQQKKYEYDSEIEAMRLDGVLYDGASFPFNYGYVAQTQASDGSELDAFVISTHPLSRETVVPSRAIGMLEVMDRGHEDHKIIAIPLHEHRLDSLRSLSDLSEEELQKFRDFYEHLAKQWSRDIRLAGFADKSRAIRELRLTQILEE